MPILQQLNSHRKSLNKVLWGLSIIPLVYYLWRFFNHDLGNNPFELLINQSGQWAMVFFLLSFAITPVRRWLHIIACHCQWAYGKRLSDYNFLIFNRRMLGLASFYYACVHLMVYLWLEMDFDWQEVVWDLKSRWHIMLGFSSFSLLLILALTSPTSVQKRLKQTWRTIHRLVYLLAPLLILHQVLETKLITWDIWLYAALTTVLLGHRMVVHIIEPLRNSRDTGMEVQR